MISHDRLCMFQITALFVEMHYSAVETHTLAFISTGLLLTSPNVIEEIDRFGTQEQPNRNGFTFTMTLSTPKDIIYHSVTLFNFHVDKVGLHSTRCLGRDTPCCIYQFEDLG